MIITISGHAGSGKSTAAKLLAARLRYRHYSMGDLRRKMAQERGLSIAELNALGEKDPFTDKEVDAYQRELGKREDDFVVDGRLSFHFIPHSFKVCLTARLEVRAQRVLQDERASEHLQGLDQAKRALEERERSDSLRYRKYYGIDHLDQKHYDVVLDTSDLRADQVVQRILEFLKTVQRNRPVEGD